jgi:phosphatidylglycerophosphatase C
MTHSSPELPAVAVFDFDGTLTTRDSFFPFLRMAVGRSRFYFGLLMVSGILAAYAVGLMKNWRAKEAVVKHFIGGWPAAKLQPLGETFAQQHIAKLLRPEAIARLHWHQSQGHQTILVSASMEIYLFPWAKAMGFDRVIGTQLETVDGIITGRFQGRNCYGPEKVDRLQAVLGDLSQYCIYAYGDSKGDRELLAAAAYPYYRTFADVRHSAPTQQQEVS